MDPEVLSLQLSGGAQESIIKGMVGHNKKVNGELILKMCLDRCVPLTRIFRWQLALLY
jgi:hypothetical protein